MTNKGTVAVASVILEETVRPHTGACSARPIGFPIRSVHGRSSFVNQLQAEAYRAKRLTRGGTKDQVEAEQKNFRRAGAQSQQDRFDNESKYGGIGSDAFFK